MAKIEILHHRDPDASCVLRVFVDGVEIQEYTVEDIDPGAGYEADEWDERIADVKDTPTYSPAFAAATLETLGDASDSPYIEGGDR